MITYRLYIPKYYQHLVVGDVPVPLDQLIRQLGNIAPGFTLIDGLGYWKSDSQIFKEPVYVFEIVTENLIQEGIEFLLKSWKEDFNQEAMFYQMYESQGVLL